MSKQVTNRRMILKIATIMISLTFSWSSAFAEEKGGGLRPTPSDSPGIDGLWWGTWGGGEKDGVVYQPASAELIIAGDQIEMAGFRQTSKLNGTVHFDAVARQLVIQPVADPPDLSKPQVVKFACDLQDNQMTLTGSDGIRYFLERVATEANSPALLSVQMELVVTTGITEEGDLLVRDYSVLQAGERKTTHYQPHQLRLKLQQATILQIQDDGWRELTVAAARELLREPTAIAIAYSHAPRQDSSWPRELWQDLGRPAPTGDAARRTLAKSLRPGTLAVFLSAAESTPKP